MTEHVARPTEVVKAFLDAFAAMDFDSPRALLSGDVWRDYVDLATAAKIHAVGAA